MSNRMRGGYKDMTGHDGRGRQILGDSVKGKLDSTREIVFAWSEESSYKIEARYKVEQAGYD